MAANPPALDTPEGRAAYRDELRTVAFAWRASGYALAAAGFGVLLMWRFMPQAPSAMAWIGAAVTALGVILLGVAGAKRTLYHRRRIAAKD